ncbi:ABC transporter ATP-binding protein [Sphingobacteriales bacterium UPWRP_1]|nr:ABC transporter [Sphingobacteriales bacterium TSM_CSS]PSJ77614.1 ABC transporter ATP-binding protein [Sphingobacteriales bacterium UPWRP_1]
MKHLRFLNKYFIKYRYRLLAGILFVVLSNIFAILPPKIIRYSFDLVKDNIVYYQMYEGFNLQSAYYSMFSHAILLFGITMLLLALLKGGFMFLMRQTLIVMSRYIEFDLRNDMYAHYQQLSTSFYRRNSTGDLMSRITEDVNRVRMYLGPAIMYAINLTVLIVIVVGTMLRVNAQLTLYVLLPLPVLATSIYLVNSVIHKRSEQIQQQLSRLTSIAQESFSGIRVVKAYVQEEPTRLYFDNESEQYKQKSLQLARVQAFFSPLMMMLVGLSTILTIYIGGTQVINGAITSGNVAEFILYVNMLTWPVTSLGWVAALIQRASASQKRINEFMSVKPDIETDSQAGNSRQLHGDVRFDAVSFTYPDTGVEALANVSFHLKPGQKMAVVGRTGSGKTTLAELLLRKYDATQGQILLDGTDIKQLPLQSLRKQTGYVPQDVFLFSDTVSGNIAFGSEPAGMEQIIHAAKQAAVFKDIEQLPKKFDTIVGERGVTLSGGQKQRISLARALIKNPQLIFFDDCLSAVDAETEETILNNLNLFLSDKTAIVITHRIFSLMNFDKILVLHHGQVAEEGTHDELMLQKGIYYDLYQKQQLETRLAT